MRSVVIWFLMIATILGIEGCGKSGPKLVRTRGQIQNKGEDFIPEDDQNLQMALIPFQTDTGAAFKNMYYGEVNQTTGSFVTEGAEKKGIPPGKYRVLLELKVNRNDIWNEFLFQPDSPLTIEVGDNSPLQIVDIGQALENLSKITKKK